MKTINLRWMYPHYRHDEFVDVTDEVWAAMYQAQREMENYERRKVYHRAYYSLDAYSWLENYALEHSRSPEDILLEREEMTTRLHLIAALPVALAHATPTRHKSLVYKGALIHRCRCRAPCRGCCVLRPRWGATLPKPLVRSAQPDTRFAFVRLHRACYPLTERRCSP